MSVSNITYRYLFPGFKHQYRHVLRLEGLSLQSLAFSWTLHFVFCLGGGGGEEALCVSKLPWYGIELPKCDPGFGSRFLCDH